jgi:hypothetical protein
LNENFGSHATWETVSFDIGFGTGFDFVLIGFRGPTDGAQIDNVFIPNPAAAQVIPEPATFVLMALGILSIIGLAGRRRVPLKVDR